MLIQLTATTSECWISVKPDGLNTQQALLKAGETKEFTANDKVLMNLGNYPALSIKVNGRPLNPDKLAHIGSVGDARTTLREANNAPSDSPGGVPGIRA